MLQQQLGAQSVQLDLPGLSFIVPALTVEVCRASTP